MISGGIWTWNACDLADAVRGGRLKAAEVLEVFLDRIRRFDPEIRSFVYVDVEGSRLQAEEIDRRVDGGEDPGPLAGVPVAVKDLEDATGLPTRAGSLLTGDRPAAADSIQVHRMRAAGAVILGKTATPEFGSLPYTWSRAFGSTHNPWGLDCTPGGSSGGSAAAVAAGLVPLATGSDGGGSIRIPASYCGLPALKPTVGLVPVAIRRQVKRLSVHGTLARSPRDIARVLDQVSGPDSADPFSLPKSPLSFEESLEAECSTLASAASPLRAVWSADLGFGWCEPEVASIARAAAERLFEAAGFVEIELPLDVSDPSLAWLAFWALNYYADLHDAWPSRKGDMTPVVSAVLQLADEIGPAEVAYASKKAFEVFQLINEVFDEVDVIVTPTMPSVAFPAQGPMPGVAPKADPGGSRLAEAAVRAYDSGIDPLSGVCFTFPFNLTGHPAVSVPAGLDQRGIPVGVQVVGPRFSDLRLLALARIMERACPLPRMPVRYETG